MTVIEYLDVTFRPLITQCSAVVVQDRFPGVATTRNRIDVTPPFEAGAAHVTETCVPVALALTFRGGLGVWIVVIVWIAAVVDEGATNS